MTPSPPRELPASESYVLKPRSHDYVVVIPVINEGERIREQLTRIAALNISVDVLIADGGSNDGSLELGFLDSVNCRALLVKKGPGKLSAQLRMAYAWALDEGYVGIVSVDGNGKDGVQAIPDFIAKLQKGYDYVQGSRYVRGGRAVNTPIDRKIAGRLIHAPVLSIFGRRWYTDTTNGFRGYSARYLKDPRVNPFRNVFSRYELLFYLTVRAGQLRYRTIEIPVIRSYPAGEKAPTKISGFRGRVEMLLELFSVAVGKYNPN